MANHFASDKTEDKPSEPPSDLKDELGRLTKEVRKQNSLRRRFLLGIIFGVGSAVGATVIAAILIVGLARLLEPIGVDFMSELRETRRALEVQDRRLPAEPTDSTEIRSGN